MSNIVRMPLSRWQKNQSLSLYQYDYGQVLLFENVELPPAYEVHFSNSDSGESITVIGTQNGVDIPDELLLTGDPIYLWVFLHSDVSDGETKYAGVINVIKRPEITDVEITPVEHDEIAEVLGALSGAVTRVENALSYVEAVGETVEDTVNNALQHAYESGMFEGEKGDKGDRGDTGSQGPQGEPGERGLPGETGSTGNGIRAVQWHDETASITFYFTNGDRFTTPTLRGPAGSVNSVASAITIGNTSINEQQLQQLLNLISQG